MYKCCETCKWRAEEPYDGGGVCVNNFSERCTDPVDDHWFCDEYEANKTDDNPNAHQIQNKKTACGSGFPTDGR